MSKRKKKEKQRKRRLRRQKQRKLWKTRKAPASKKPCNCLKPFPCAFPVHGDVMCDECGDWLLPERANATGLQRFFEIFETKQKLRQADGKTN